MKKVLLVGLTLLLPLTAFAGVQRNPVLEVVTSTDDRWCPGATLAAEDYREEYGKKAVIVEYHGTRGIDPFKTKTAVTREKYYEVTQFPTSLVDGILKQIMASPTRSIYKQRIKPKVDKRMGIEAPVSIKLEKKFTPDGYLSATGKLTATITNESDAELTGKVHFIINESHIAYKWETQDSLFWVERNMNNDAKGEGITLAAGADTVMEHTFDIDPKWYKTTGYAINFELICFVQNNSTKEIYQGAWIPLMFPLAVEYKHSVFNDGNDNKINRGEKAKYLVTLKNSGKEKWASLTGKLSTTDPEITIFDSTATWGACDAGNSVTNNDDPFEFQASINCPKDHKPLLHLTVDDGGGKPVELEYNYEPTGIAEDGYTGFSISVPEFISNKSAVALSVGSAADVDVLLFDAAGCAVKTLYSGTATAGLNIIPISVNDIPEGVYFVKASIGAKSDVEKVLVVH